MIFGRLFKSRFADEREITATKRLWFIQLDKNQVTQNQISYSLQQIIDTRMKYPPEVTEFLKLCDACVCEELPDKELAYQEIIDWFGKWRNQPKPPFSHRVVQVIHEHIGVFCQQESGEQFKKRFDKSWEKHVLMFRRNVLPPPKDPGKALAPPKTDPRVDKLLKETTFSRDAIAVEKRIEAIRKSSDG